MKEKIENDIEIHKNQLNRLREELKLDPYKVPLLLLIPDSEQE